MSPSSQTLAAAGRQKPAGAYGSMLRKMTTRMKQLQEEVGLESVTSMEFEESSRRSFEFLTGQVKTLKEAFNTLTDTFLQELENLSGAISSEFWRLEDGILKDFGEQLGDTMHRGEQLEKHTEQLAKDLDAVLGVIPKIEDSMLRTNRHVQEALHKNEEKIEQVSLDVIRSSTAVQNLEEKVGKVGTDLREELISEIDQRLLKQQRSITRQLEGMSAKLNETADADRGGRLSHSMGSGMGGGTFGGEGAQSPWRDRDRPRERDRDGDRDRDRDQPWRDRDHGRDGSPSPWRNRDRDRDRDGDRSWSGKQTSERSERGDRSPPRLPVERRRDDIGSFRGGIESYRDRIGSIHDSPRGATRRDSSPENARPWQSRREGDLSPAVSVPKPGHIQVDLNLSGLQGTSPQRGAR